MTSMRFFPLSIVSTKVGGPAFLITGIDEDDCPQGEELKGKWTLRSESRGIIEGLSVLRKRGLS